MSTPFFGVGGYFYSPDVNEKGSGEKCLRLFYQLTFVSVTTTIASAAMAERANMKAFMLYGLLNTFIYSFPALCYLFLFSEASFYHYQFLITPLLTSPARVGQGAPGFTEVYWSALGCTTGVLPGENS